MALLPARHNPQRAEYGILLRPGLVLSHRRIDVESHRRFGEWQWTDAHTLNPFAGETDMKIKYRVDLTNEVHDHLLKLTGKGEYGARTMARARILRRLMRE